MNNILSSILNHIDKCKASESISSIFQGEVWKKIEARYEGKMVFPLLLYFDDVEINNPLDSRANKHKLGAVYFSLSCIPYEFSSKLDNLFLAQLHNSSDHKMAGNKKVFQNITEQIIDLEENGLSINVDGSQYVIFFALFAITGDNLALNEIYGFTTSFNSLH